MDCFAPKRAAGLIADARQNGVLLTTLPSDCRPQTLAEGYAVQHAFIEKWDAPAAGWKCAATAKDVQKAYAIKAPFYGRLFAPTVFQSPAEVSANDFGLLYIETEFAFRFGSALPPRMRVYEREEVSTAVHALIPSLEIISPRFDSLLISDMPTCAADCAINGGAVLGQPCQDWQHLDLAHHEVRFSINGQERSSGTGAKALGHPINVLEWLINALSLADIGIARDEVVLTGTCTGFHRVEAGDHVVGDFGSLGNVEIHFI